MYPLYTNTNTGAVQWEKPQMEAMTNPMNRASHGRSETVLPSSQPSVIMPLVSNDPDMHVNAVHVSLSSQVSQVPSATEGQPISQPLLTFPSSLNLLIVQVTAPGANFSFMISHWLTTGWHLVLAMAMDLQQLQLSQKQNAN